VVGPGVEPRWTSSAKSGVGTALDGRSHVWFTISHGIIDEVYYPRVDQANTRDLGLLVSGPGGFFSEEKRDSRSEVHLIAPGVPGYRVVNTCTQGRYEIEKTVITDPERDVLMQRIRFRALQGRVEDYRIFALLAPHICNQGFGNDGWAERYKGVPMLFARRQDVALALSCDAGWSAMSCGYVGVNDGWRQVKEHGYLAEPCPEVRAGNIALTGEVNLAGALRPQPEVAEFVVVLAFGLGPAEAAQRSRMSLASSFQLVQDSYTREWTRFHEHTVGPRLSNADSTMPEQARQTAARDLASLAHGSTHAHRETPKRPKGERRRKPPITLPDSVVDLYRMSAAILAIHEDKRASGAIIASLSIPWGNTKSDHELGGYHLVWPRDLVNSAGALIALGHNVLARRTLRYLMSTQEEDGRWAQNLWLDGTPYWNGVQMDEIAFPILFAEMLRREGKLADLDPYPMIRRAAGFLLRNGPATGQDRWEENGGYSTFTLAVEVSAMLVAAEFADRAHEPALGALLRDTADAWNARIEEWTYVRNTPIAREVGVEGYYVRVAPADVADAAPASHGYIPIKNRVGDDASARYDEIVSPDALALVRFGLRDPLDPRIVNTVRVIDAMLRAHTSTGPAWYRYNRDGYGEHEDGSPFDGCGVGRPWPLLAGERAHYELAAGRCHAAARCDARAGERWRHAARTSVGWRGQAGVRADEWPGDGRSDAAGVGPCGVREARALTARWSRVRHAAAVVRAICARASRVRHHHLGAALPCAIDAGGKPSACARTDSGHHQVERERIRCARDNGRRYHRGSLGRADRHGATPGWDEASVRDHPGRRCQLERGARRGNHRLKQRQCVPGTVYQVRPAGRFRSFCSPRAS
jgi:glucoamylase